MKRDPNEGLGGTGEDEFAGVAKRMGDEAWDPLPAPPPAPEPTDTVMGEDSVLGDLGKPIVDAFSGRDVTAHEPPARAPDSTPSPGEGTTFFDELVSALRRSMFIDRGTAAAFAFAFLFTLGGAYAIGGAQSPQGGVHLTGAPATATGQVPEPSATPALVRLTTKVVSVGLNRSGQCDPHVVRFLVLDQSLLGHTVVLQLETKPVDDPLQQPKKLAPPQRVEGVISADAPSIETPVYPFTTATVTAVSLDGKPATGSAGFGNTGAKDCQQ